jgi:hypothetical protein
MLVLVSLIPLYVFIPEIVAGRELLVPDVPLDHLVPLRPAWALVYGALYLYLILLPVLVVRAEEHINRTVLAYLTVWLAAYACFLTFPPSPRDLLRWSGRVLVPGACGFSMGQTRHITASPLSTSRTLSYRR